MSDELVQRLRGYARQGAWLSQLRDDAADAADEIERLRAEVETCRALYALRMRERASEDVRLADTIARAERAESALADLHMQYDSLKGVMHDEIAANLAFREAGGALPDEDMPTFCARLLSERAALRKRVATCRCTPSCEES